VELELNSTTVYTNIYGHGDVYLVLCSSEFIPAGPSRSTDHTLGRIVVRVQSSAASRRAAAVSVTLRGLWWQQKNDCSERPAGNQQSSTWFHRFSFRNHEEHVLLESSVLPGIQRTRQMTKKHSVNYLLSATLGKVKTVKKLTIN